MLFWLGTHQPGWLARTNAPLFVSAVRLRGRKTLPRAVGRWALDSGGFSEIAAHGRWTIPAAQYAAEARLWRAEVGGLAWAAVQDWMCEPVMLERTGLTVGEHQRRTVASYLELRALAPEMPWVPVLQGWEPADYHRCADLYAAAGVDLPGLPVVGLGSVCRRQGTRTAARIVRGLYDRGLENLHGFGFKTLGLVGRARLARFLASSDSMAWSTDGRMNWGHRRRRMCPVEHPGGCANCLHWAVAWRRRMAARTAAATAPRPMTLFG